MSKAARKARLAAATKIRAARSESTKAEADKARVPLTRIEEAYLNAAAKRQDRR